MARRDRIPAKVQITGDRNQRSLDRSLKQARRKIHQVNDALKATRRIALGMATAMTGFLGATVALAAKQQKAVAGVAGALRTQGRLTRESLELQKKIAAEVQKTTTYGDEDVLGAQTLLLRLGQVSDDLMPRIVGLTTDLATTLGTDVSNAALLVGRLMSDPAANMGLLTRYGVSITESTKEYVKELQAAGKKQEASLVLVREMEKLMGGAAAAIAKTDIGKWQQLRNLIGDIGERIGGRLLRDFEGIRKRILSWAEALGGADDAADRLYNTIKRGLLFAFSWVVVSSVLIAINKIRLALVSIKMGAGAAALATRGIWIGLTGGLALFLPFFIKNWDNIKASFWAGAEAIKVAFVNLWDDIKYGWGRTRAAFWAGVEAIKVGFDNLVEDTAHVFKKLGVNIYNLAQRGKEYFLGLVNDIARGGADIVNKVIEFAEGIIHRAVDALSDLLKAIGVEAEKLKKVLALPRIPTPDEYKPARRRLGEPTDPSIGRETAADAYDRVFGAEAPTGGLPSRGREKPFDAAKRAFAEAGGGEWDFTDPAGLDFGGSPGGLDDGIDTDSEPEEHGPPLPPPGWTPGDEEGEVAHRRTTAQDLEAMQEEALEVYKERLEDRKDPLTSYWDWVQSETGGAYKKLDKFARASYERDRKLWDQRTKLIRSHFTDFGQALQDAGIKSKALQKAIALGQIALGIARIPADYANFLSAFSYLGPAAPAAAAAMTALQLAGLVRAQAEVAGMQEGGLVAGGSSITTDSVPALLQAGELVVPRQNFGEVVDAVAAARVAEDAGASAEGDGEGGNIHITLELDSIPIFDEVVSRATAERVIR